MHVKPQIWIALLFVNLALCSGCSTFRTYKTETAPVVQHTSNGQIDQALAKLEENAPKERDILYYMEKGELLRLKKAFPDSSSAWKEADKMIDVWEHEAKMSFGKAGRGLSSMLLNDKSMRYDGEDYEKVMLSTRLALDHISLGNYDAARIEIKKTHEREALIEELHSKETQEQEEEAKQKGVTSNVSDLKGYPIATLNSQEVTKLRNGYQSAFSHYLAGFVYEALGESGLAAPGYRKAIELNPEVQSIKNDLSGLDKRISAKKQNDADVLFIVESGFAPSLNSIKIPIPIPQVGVVPISFPVLESDPSATISAKSIKLNDKNTVQLDTITNVDAMAKRSLRDRLPGILVRSVLRGAAKAASQKLAYQANGFAGLAVNLFNVATESADERLWKSLPSSISIARARMPIGKSNITLSTSQGDKDITIDVKGNYAIVPMRLMPNSLYLVQQP